MSSRRFKLYRAYSISFTSSNVDKGFLELNSKGLYQSSGKPEKNCCLVFLFSTKRGFRHFNVVVVQRRQKMYKKKRDTRAKLLFCQSKQRGLLLFRCSRCCCRRGCLSSLMLNWEILQKKNFEKKNEKQV